ncbi:hypothetical protein PPTG_18869 [Phytophthora nicotianae INRA-310]|uniref:Uncharacterized protein n=1 Tax=Phytophthora nicotianae (strain INRA-310) TaxID=761204 RepID=W2PGR7_PHYN3|nr:hypothetical protein PPTG_18869 [Phytophthora nicotianae INRA-310]ETM99413.1 hypothetical protein PPTG_18869 [Phytophthora nicotianae INRA-310]
MHIFRKPWYAVETTVRHTIVESCGITVRTASSTTDKQSVATGGLVGRRHEPDEGQEIHDAGEVQELHGGRRVVGCGPGEWNGGASTILERVTGGFGDGGHERKHGGSTADGRLGGLGLGLATVAGLRQEQLTGEFDLEVRPRVGRPTCGWRA